MPETRRTLSVTLAALFLAGSTATACGTDTAPSGWATAVDTLDNGAVLVRHTPPADPAPTWRLEPGLRIGAVDGAGPNVFGQIAGLDVMADGRIVVLDYQAQEVRIFGPDGGHLATHGGKGGGPGEFQAANGVAVGPDGLIRVPDSRNARLSYLHPDSGFLRSHPYEPRFGGLDWGGRVDSAGRAWGLHYFMAEDADRPYTWVAYTPEGDPVDTIAQPRGRPSPEADLPGRWVQSFGSGGMLSLGVPYYADAQFELSSSLHVWSTPEGDPSLRLIRWGAAEDTALILHVERPPVPTPTERADSVTSGWEERFGVSLDRSKIPELAHMVGTFFFDHEHRVWVRVFAPADDSLRTYDAFDAEDGAYLGTLVTDLELRDRPDPVIRGDTVWAVVVNEMDVPFVVRGRLAELR